MQYAHIVIIGLCKTYVRPHHGNAAHALTIGDNVVFEAFQTRTMKVVSNSELNLKDRRKRGDLILVYRVLPGKVDVGPTSWFPFYQPAEDTA